MLFYFNVNSIWQLHKCLFGFYYKLQLYLQNEIDWFIQRNFYCKNQANTERYCTSYTCSGRRRFARNKWVREHQLRNRERTADWISSCHSDSCSRTTRSNVEPKTGSRRRHALRRLGAVKVSWCGKPQRSALSAYPLSARLYLFAGNRDSLAELTPIWHSLIHEPFSVNEYKKWFQLLSFV